MLRLFKMNLYRTLRSKSAWILIIVAIGITIMGNGINKIASVYIEKNTAIESTEVAETGIGVEATEESQNTIFSVLAGDMKAGMLLIFIIIFASLFISAEEKNGYVKNVSSLVKNREDMVLPRIAAIAVYTLAFYIIYMLAEGISYLILFPGTAIGFEASYLGFFALEYLLSLCVVSLTVLITSLTRSSGLGLTVGILLATGFHMIFAQLGNMLINAVAGKTVIDLNEYLTVTWISQLDPISTTKWLWAGVLGLIYLAVWNIVNIIIVRKRDVA